MREPITNEPDDQPQLRVGGYQAIGVRYSLKDMLSEVKDERAQSAQGRELLDETEIGKMFAEKRYRKRTKK
jgi:hypothetical protein